MACRNSGSRDCKTVTVMRRTLLISILFVGAARGAVLADDEDTPVAAADPSAPGPAEEHPDDAQRRNQLEAAGEASTSFTSNLFKEQNRRVDDFDSKNDPGERYYGMEGPSDLVTRLELEGGIEHKLGHKRKLEAVVSGEYFVHARNAIANYAELGAKVSYDITRRTELELTAGLVPRRFHKNYAARLDGAGGKVFEKAYAMTGEAGAELEHHWSGWRATGAYDLLVQRFEDPFENRDRTGHDVTIEVGREVTDRVVVGGAATGGVATTPGLVELGVAVDRSYWQAGAGGFAEADLRHRWKLEGELGYRMRQYTTDVVMDDAHYQRVDHRVKTDVTAEKTFGKRWTLLLEGGWTEQLSDRSDPALDTDEAGYRELVIGAGVRGEL